MDDGHRFDRLADDYTIGRPGYPAALAAWVPSAAVGVDLACGTGLSTRVFRGRFDTLLGVDPSEPMLARARARAAPGERYLQGTAEDPPLGPASADVFLVGQGLHWFDLPATVAALRTAGRNPTLIAFWNRRPDIEPWQTYESLLLAHCPDYAGIRARWDDTVDRLDALLAQPAERAVFDNPQHYDTDRMLALARSSSYVASSPTRDALLDALAAAWTPTTTPFTTHAFRWQL